MSAPWESEGSAQSHCLYWVPHFCMGAYNLLVKHKWGFIIEGYNYNNTIIRLKSGCLLDGHW